MDINNLKSFIKYGTDEQQSSEKFILGALGIVALSLLGGIFGFGYPQTLWMSIVIYVLSIIFLTLLFILSKNLNLTKRIKCSAIITIFTTTLFTFLSAIFLAIKNVPFVALICCIPMFLAILSASVCYIRLKMKKYLNKKNNQKYNNIIGYAAIGSALGLFLFRNYLTQTPIATVPPEIIVAILLELVACLFAIMGAPTFLKLYYVKKLNSEEINLNE